MLASRALLAAETTGRTALASMVEVFRKCWFGQATAAAARAQAAAFQCATVMICAGSWQAKKWAAGIFCVAQTPETAPRTPRCPLALSAPVSSCDKS
jgi:hypothetical protein